MKNNGNAVRAAALVAVMVAMMAAGSAHAAMFRLPVGDWNGGNVSVGRGYQHTLLSRGRGAARVARTDRAARASWAIRIGVDDFLPGIMPTPVLRIGGDY
jgi:hypothetical protein